MQRRVPRPSSTGCLGRPRLVPGRELDVGAATDTMGGQQLGLLLSVDLKGRVTRRGACAIAARAGQIFEEARIGHESIASDRELEGECIAVGVARLVRGRGRRDRSNQIKRTGAQSEVAGLGQNPREEFRRRGNPQALCVSP